MKKDHYDRNLKKWVNPTENVGDLKKKELCKGQNPHKVIFAQPWGIKQELTQEQIQQYHDSEMRIWYTIESEYRDMEKLGIKTTKWNPKPSMPIMCEVCGKKITL